ncbi:M15 family metallopeptidase [Aurantivibrio plasticivorans]
MKRRDLLTGIFAGGAFSAGNGMLWRMAQQATPQNFGDEALTVSEPVTAKELAPDLDKVKFFENEFIDDLYLPQNEFTLLTSVLHRLDNAQRVIGHGNFNLLGFDDLLRYAKRYESIGEFSATELDFMEKIFFTEAQSYGFYGEKVTDQMTAVVPERDTFRVPYTGHYVFRGESLAYYDKLVNDVGSQIVLTSGIRSVVKQMHLFLAKCAKSNGNLSKASRSLAPPGHSFHGIGDFDVGRRGWGADNFTSKFAQTIEFQKMQELGYVQIRYTEDNQLGVRFEPWHIKVV